jgi:hypothetical protein
MGTSGRRTPPAPVSAEPPKGARTAFAACQKLEKVIPVSRGLRIFFAATYRLLGGVAQGLVLGLGREVPEGAGNLG